MGFVELLLFCPFLAFWSLLAKCERSLLECMVSHILMHYIFYLFIFQCGVFFMFVIDFHIVIHFALVWKWIMTIEIDFVLLTYDSFVLSSWRLLYLLRCIKLGGSNFSHADVRILLLSMWILNMPDLKINPSTVIMMCVNWNSALRLRKRRRTFMLSSFAFHLVF